VDRGTSADQQGDAAARTPDKLEELTSLVKSLISFQAARDQKIEVEAMCQEQRWKTMQHQFLQIQAQVKEIKEDHEDRSECRDSDDTDDEEDTEVLACRAS